MRQLKFCLLCFFVCATALSMTTANASDPVRLQLQNQFLLAQQGECSRLVGPFVTQTTAWQKLREAESEGYAVSGVFPCDDGYCFNIFFPC